MASALDRWWGELGRPDPFVVVEAGAGTGALTRAVVAAAPDCSPALRYVLVERSAALRRRRRLPLEPAGLVLGPVGPGGAAAGEEGPRPEPGAGPLLASLAELPVGPLTGVVLANELLDNLPFRLLERDGDGWSEVRVGLDGAEVADVLVPASPELAAEAARLAPEAPAGGRIPLQHRAVGWLRAALALLERGRVVAADYADTTPSMAGRPWTEWVRTYRAHGRGGHPLEALGDQDVTCEVAVDQLARVRRPHLERSQAEFLRAHGLDRLVDQARGAWQERAHVGDLEALKARSRLGEAAALADPTGLGAFRVLEWEVGVGS